MKTPQTNRAYHKRVLQEVTQMLRISGKVTEVEAKPISPSDHAWAAQKLKALVKA